MNSTDLQHFLDKQGVTAEIIHLATDTPTVAAAAEAINGAPEQIVKTILFLADKRPLLVIASGLTRIDYKRLADYLGLSRRRIKSAHPEQVLEILGFPVGAVPPFGHKTPIKTLVEADVLAQTEVYGGGGEINALMRFSCDELLRVTEAEVVPLAKMPSE